MIPPGAKVVDTQYDILLRSATQGYLCSFGRPHLPVSMVSTLLAGTTVKNLCSMGQEHLPVRTIRSAYPAEELARGGGPSDYTGTTGWVLVTEKCVSA